jgi:hypothetical protein
MTLLLRLLSGLAQEVQFLACILEVSGSSSAATRNIVPKVLRDYPQTLPASSGIITQIIPVPPPPSRFINFFHNVPADIN